MFAALAFRLGGMEGDLPLSFAHAPRTTAMPFSSCLSFFRTLCRATNPLSQLIRVCCGTASLPSLILVRLTTLTPRGTHWRVILLSLPVRSEAVVVATRGCSYLSRKLALLAMAMTRATRFKVQGAALPACSDDQQQQSFVDGASRCTLMLSHQSVVVSELGSSASPGVASTTTDETTDGNGKRQASKRACVRGKSQSEKGERRGGPLAIKINRLPLPNHTLPSCLVYAASSFFFVRVACLLPLRLHHHYQ